MNLRPYQTETIHALRTAFANKHKNVILCLPTGSGKTVVFSEMAKLAFQRGTKTLVLTDRIELFKQTFSALSRHGVNVQELNATKRTADFNPNALLTVAMVETIKRRKIPNYQPQLIIIDEAHKGNFNRIIEKFPNARIIGATATPVGKHIPKYYTEIVNTIDIPELILKGFLSPCRAFQMVDDFSDLEVQRGEYTERSLFNHFDNKKLYSGVLEQWTKRAHDKKTIVFNVNIEHAEQMTREFVDAGIRSACVTSKTPKAERDAILSAFSSGDLQVLNNCGILTTGYDEPSIECVIMNRKTKSLALWLQCCGRGSRIYPNKTHFTVLDFGMNHDVHGLWSEPRTWKIEQPRKKKKQESPVKECPNCEAMLNASAKVCQYCEHEFKTTASELATGVMVEVGQRIPVALIGRRLSSCNVDELIQLQNVGKYKPSFIWRVVRALGPASVSEYGQKKGYSSGWVWRQKQQINDCNFKNYMIQ